jgi:hypothetical protein
VATVGVVRLNRAPTLVPALAVAVLAAPAAPAAAAPPTADVRLVDGELRVAHDLVDAEPGVTPEPLSLDPLAERVAANGGSVYRGWDGSLQLLIDTESDGPATCAAVDEALRAYPQLMTRWTDGRTKERAVTAVISWRELVRAGVDHVDTDDLAGLQAFLLAEDPDEQRAAA